MLSNMNEIDSLVFEYLRLKHPKGWDCSEADFISEVQRLRAVFTELLNPPQRDIPPVYWLIARVIIDLILATAAALAVATAFSINSLSLPFNVSSSIIRQNVG